MENQDVYNIYRVYKEGYFGNEDRQSEMDPHRAHEYYGSGLGAYHFILVRNKVVKLVKEKGLRGLGFRRPVHLV